MPRSALRIAFARLRRCAADPGPSKQKQPTSRLCGAAGRTLHRVRDTILNAPPTAFASQARCPLSKTSDTPRTTITPEETPMLTLHHLNDSRSQRILWLLEELAVPYEMKRYQRNPETRLAPPELKAVHPLGKSPVITDGDIRIAESGAIVDYVIRRYGQGNGKPAMMPAPGSADYETYNEWL